MRWDMDPIIARFGAIELRWYGLFFATGLLLCAWKAPKYFQLWGLPKQHAERLTLWVPIGMLLGAHYIHLIFYETENLFDFSIEVRSWFPPDISLGRFWALGSGLASHGGGLGCLLALLLFWHLYGKPLKIPFHRYADAVMIVSIWVYGWVRLGNFFNSEIVGRPTDLPWGVIFERPGYTEPRHPVQLYEAALYFAELAFATLWWQPRFARKLRPGTSFYFFLMVHFTLRFIAEFAKDYQHVDVGWSLNMGQWLSIPVVVVCAFMLFGTKRFNLLAPLAQAERDAIDESARLAEAYEATLEGGSKPSGEEDAKGAEAEPKPAKAAGKRKGKKAAGGRGADA